MRRDFRIIDSKFPPGGILLVRAEKGECQVKVYSPSQTATWMRCPMLRALGKAGWIPKVGAKRDIAATIGQAFAAGVGVYNNMRKDTQAFKRPMPERGGDERVQWAAACVDVALQVAHRRLEEMERIGLQLSMTDADAHYLQQVDPRIRKSVSNYVLNDPLPDEWEIVSVEESLGEEAGNSRPDLIVRDGDGLAVVDYKTKVELKAQYYYKTVGQYANSHQMLHYGHFASRKFGEDFAKYYIGLAIFEPKWRFDLLPYPYNPETMATWAGTVTGAWAQMEKEDNGEAAPWMAATHEDNFGQCPYYKACFTHHYDPALMLQDYLLVERVPEEEPHATNPES